MLEPNPTQNASTPKPLRALVVDDREDVTRSLAMLLKRLGHGVHMAFFGREALEKAAAERPDVIFLDIGLPDLSGYDVCKEIRQSDWGPKCFMVALTGRNEPADLVHAANSGFDRHVAKPMDFATLQEILHVVKTRAGLPAAPPPGEEPKPHA